MDEFKHVFGPVPSRRMGLSIGISPIPDGHCNYSCLYCQLGRTSRMTNKREEYFPLEEILKEFRSYLENDMDYDVVTIVGDGEPLLYSRIGDLIDGLKGLTKKPIALITNGALLSDEAVREEVKKADIVLPSLDAYNQELFRKINRPRKEIDFHDQLEGLINFSKIYEGQLWIESMVLAGINDSKEGFLKLRDLLREMDYERLYINTPVRPPAESYVKQASREAIEEAVSILGGISIDELVSEGFYSSLKDDYQAVVSIIRRHPMNQFEIESFLKSRGNEDVKILFQALDRDDLIEKVDYKGYWTYRLRKKRR